MNLVPAYGNDYKSRKEVEAALKRGSDFKIADISSEYDGAYINREDMLKQGITRVTIRYKRLASVGIFDVK